MTRQILIVDDNRDILTAARILLTGEGYDVLTEHDPRKIPYLIKENSFSVILLDMNYTEGTVSGDEGIKWLEVILDHDPDAVVILITAYGDIETAVRAIKKGAADFVQKPWENRKLLSTVSLAVQLKETKRQASLYEARNSYLKRNNSSIIGQSPVMGKVFDLIRKVSPTDANVLITGENGTGKDLIAKAVHENSRRKESVFLGVDMGSFPESLFESELFGHEKGAFTGAEKKRIGRIEAASGGTLFLDEIGNIPINLQPKLLRVLETREVISLGGKGGSPFDVRLICATNSDVKEMVQNNRFRQDLLYRINTVEIHLPPLRERAGDIDLLLNHFLSVFAEKYQKQGLTVSSEARKKLSEYRWPGNVRELKHLVERAVILCDGTELRSGDFALSCSGEENGPQQYNLKKMEKRLIARALADEDNNLSRTADLLGISRATLYRKMDRYDL